MKKGEYYHILEIAYCIEFQYEPDTRLNLLAGGGLWINGPHHKGRPNLKSPYDKWIDKMFKQARGIYYRNRGDFK